MFDAYGLASEESELSLPLSPTIALQEGVLITGLACRLSSGHRIFADGPVSGRYPSFTFAYGGDTITGWAAAEDSIVAYRSSIGEQQPIRFRREAASEYDHCTNARP